MCKVKAALIQWDRVELLMQQVLSAYTPEIIISAYMWKEIFGFIFKENAWT